MKGKILRRPNTLTCVFPYPPRWLYYNTIKESRKKTTSRVANWVYMTCHSSSSHKNCNCATNSFFFFFFGLWLLSRVLVCAFVLELLSLSLVCVFVSQKKKKIQIVKFSL